MLTLARLAMGVATVGLAGALGGCGEERSIRDFPTQTQASRVGAIDPELFRPAYAGGRLTRIAVDAQGFLYVAASDPCQLLRIAPNGQLEWADDGATTSEGVFQGPVVNVSVHAGGALFMDAGAARLYDFESAGALRREVALSEAFDAAISRSGEVFLFPNTHGFLLDVLDADFRYVRSIVPLPDSPANVAPSACRLLAAPDEGVFVLWNPTRKLYRFAADGKPRGVFTIDPPELVSNLAARLQAAQTHARARGLQATIDPFVDLLQDRQGLLAVLYLFATQPGADQPAGQGPLAPSYEAALYRFTPDGRPVDSIRGLGSIRAAAFGLDSELFGLDPVSNQIIRYRLSPPRA